MTREYKYGEPKKGVSLFRRKDGDLNLHQLLGMPCKDTVLFSLATNTGTSPLRTERTRCMTSAVNISWQAPSNGLKVESSWTFSASDGIWSRRDTIENISSKTVIIERCLARFVFTPGQYEIYVQSSRWCRENQGAWQAMDHGEIILSCDGGRSTQGGTPYLCLRKAGSSKGVAFHILPCGDWVIRAKIESTGVITPPSLAIELGLSDHNLKLRIAPGERIELPEIVLQPTTSETLHLSAAPLHSYLLKRQPRDQKPAAPVVYNTWLDNYEFLEPDRLERQLAAAKSIGCEVFVVDAGWYGSGEDPWELQVGDWREKCGSAFDGQMITFADKVRATGLGFGLWMEPERLGASVPARRQHPSWFKLGGDGFYYPDMGKNSEARAWVFSEMSRLIETYQLVWMKVDFNALSLGQDPLGHAFSGYYTAWYEVLDELRHKYPDTFLEGCASGGMRLDLNTLAHFDGHFLTDNANPWDVLRINQSALLRLPPGRLTKWTVLRSAGQTIPKYGTRIDAGDATLVTPTGGLWDKSETVDVDFAALVAMPGIFGLNGDLAGLPDAALNRLRHHVAFFKKWRWFMTDSIAHLLTPPRPICDRSGWAAIQFQNPRSQHSLVFVYRLDDASSLQCFRLQGLEAGKPYEIQASDHDDKPPRQVSGEELMTAGLSVELATCHSATVITIM